MTPFDPWIGPGPELEGTWDPPPKGRVFSSGAFCTDGPTHTHVVSGNPALPRCNFPKKKKPDQGVARGPPSEPGKFGPAGKKAAAPPPSPDGSNRGPKKSETAKMRFSDPKFALASLSQPTLPIFGPSPPKSEKPGTVQPPFWEAGKSITRRWGGRGVAEAGPPSLGG